MSAHSAPTRLPGSVTAVLRVPLAPAAPRAWSNTTVETCGAPVAWIRSVMPAGTLQVWAVALAVAPASSTSRSPAVTVVSDGNVRVLVVVELVELASIGAAVFTPR